MGLKALLIVGAAVFLPACTTVEVKQASEKLIPIQVKETVKVTQIQPKPELVEQQQKVSRSLKPKQHYTHDKHYAKPVKKSRAKKTTVQKNVQKKLKSLAALLCVNKKPKTKTEKSYFQEGKASYYSSALHGRKTASGQIYNENKLTAAHKNLPFGTKVKVINKANGRSVLVSINDRGPFVKKRILDLSYFAAKQLNMIRAGVSNIKMEIVQ